ncbi:hypothetical protein [Escherichia coli]|uniref:hypothetical protein n=1 Tax=Escherichia coli TaxID=562 RepID=UPI0012FD1918|nr:hypothetical protein [Escherichia coli]MVV97510.1 hypothetical protein [Escherichia coli]MWP11858.1 hypothetical protein [Escherichia coli]
MFFMPVDLFSPFIQGREYAIGRNWNDLNQANKVEQGWLNNDAQRWRNMFTEDTYQDKLQQYQNQTAASNMERQIAEAGHPGNVALAGYTSDYGEALAKAARGYIPQLVTGQTTAWLGNAAQQKAQGEAQLKYAPDLFGGLAGHNVDKLQKDRNLLDLEYAAKQAALAAQINNALTPAGGTTSGTGLTLTVPDKFKQPSKQSTPTPQVQQPTQQTVPQPAAVQQTSQVEQQVPRPTGLPRKYFW